MQNLSDQELDDLFKQAAEKSAGDTVMPDWTDMDNRLNEAERTGVFWRANKIIRGSIMVITVAVLVWWGMDEAKTRMASTTTQVLTKRNDTTGSIAMATSEEAEKKLKPESINTLNHITDEIVAKQETVSRSHSSLNVQEKSTVERVGKQSGEKKKSSEQSNAINGVNNSRKMLDKESVASTSGYVLAEDKASTVASIQTNAVQVGPVSFSNKAEWIVVDSVETEKQEHETELLNEEEEDTQTQLHKHEDPLHRKFYQRFLIRLSISPDYSTVESIQPDKIGLNYGLLAEYTITKNLSVAAGLIRSNKFYTAHNIEYYGQTSDRVVGDCKMWDVPIMLYYNFSPERKWSFYAGLGVSSYLMSNENYVYTIKGGYGNIYTYYKTIHGQNKEWFSMLNLSVGLSKQLNAHWAIQLEPFYKAPLAGVGEGDVSLASLGAFFNVKYRFWK